MKRTGFYIVKERFFEDMSDPFLKGNKGENRPHYYCFEDTHTGIYWMIPLSSRIDKYKRIVEKKEQAGKPCDILHIVKLDNSRESVFLIQSSVTDKWTYSQNNWAESKESHGNVETWCKVYTNTAGCCIDFRKADCRHTVDSVLILPDFTGILRVKSGIGVYIKPMNQITTSAVKVTRISMVIP